MTLANVIGNLPPHRALQSKAIVESAVPSISPHFIATTADLHRTPGFRCCLGDVIEDIGSFGVHYLHVKGRGPRTRPLFLMNGWPSSFVEYGKLAPRLADPASFGGSSDDAFDVVIPALPGFGFSDRPTRPNQVNAQNLFHSLMTEHLGHANHVAAGTDIGAGVAACFGLQYPDAVRGIHLSAVVDPPETANAGIRFGRPTGGACKLDCGEIPFLE